MKMNVFVEQYEFLKNNDGTQLVTIGGHRAIDVFDPEEQIAEEFDKLKFSPEHWRAKKFIEFLGHRNIDMDKLIQLNLEEQLRLRKEFMEIFEA